MIGWLRLGLFGLIGLTVVYLIVSAYSASVRRERLEKAWDADPKGDAAARAVFVEQGMARYRHGLRRKLILLVYLVPIVVVAVVTYFLNFS